MPFGLVDDGWELLLLALAVGACCWVAAGLAAPGAFFSTPLVLALAWVLVGALEAAGAFLGMGGFLGMPFMGVVDVVALAVMVFTVAREVCSSLGIQCEPKHTIFCFGLGSGRALL